MTNDVDIVVFLRPEDALRLEPAFPQTECKRRSKSAAGAGRKVRHQRWRIMRLLPQVKSGFTEISLWNIRSGAQDVPQGRRQGGLPSPSPFLRVPKTVTFSVRLQDMYPMREPIQHRSRQTLAPQHFRPILKR